MVFIREQYPGLISEGKILAVGFNIYLTKSVKYRRYLSKKNKRVITRTISYSLLLNDFALYGKNLKIMKNIYHLQDACRFQ